MVLPHRLADDLTDRQPRGQAGIGVLEDDLHPRAHLPQFLLAQGEHVHTLQQHFAGGLFQQAQDRAPAGGFAAAAFAHQAHGLPAPDFEGNPVHSLHVADCLLDDAGLDREPFYEVFDLKHVFAVRGGFFFHLFHVRAPPRSQISDCPARCRCRCNGSRRPHGYR